MIQFLIHKMKNCLRIEASESGTKKIWRFLELYESQHSTFFPFFFLSEWLSWRQYWFEKWNVFEAWYLTRCWKNDSVLERSTFFFRVGITKSRKENVKVLFRKTTPKRKFGTESNESKPDIWNAQFSSNSDLREFSIANPDTLHGTCITLWLSATLFVQNRFLQPLHSFLPAFFRLFLKNDNLVEKLWRKNLIKSPVTWTVHPWLKLALTYSLESKVGKAKKKFHTHEKNSLPDFSNLNLHVTEMT